MYLARETFVVHDSYGVPVGYFIGPSEITTLPKVSVMPEPVNIFDWIVVFTDTEAPEMELPPEFTITVVSIFLFAELSLIVWAVMLETESCRDGAVCVVATFDGEPVPITLTADTLKS